MTATPVRAQRCLRRTVLVVVFGLSACAGQPPRLDAGARGVGTPGVSAYMPDGQAPTLPALLERCQQASQQASAPAANRLSLEAAWDELKRQRHNQPGNSMAINSAD